MSDFHVYSQHRNRPDLIRAAVASMPEFHGKMTIVDNSPCGFWTPDFPLTMEQIFRPSAPLTFTQTHGWFFKDAIERGAKFIIWFHADAVSASGSHTLLLDFTRRIIAEGRKWHTIWTNYDSIASVNLASIQDVGSYDTCIRKYLADNDLHYRMRLKGWECIDSGIHAIHHGSQTIKSDQKLRIVNDVIHRIDRDYYVAKWGNFPGQETYTVPFNRPDLFHDLKPIGVW